MKADTIRVTRYEKKLLEKVKEGDLEARNKLVMKYYPLVVKMACSYAGKGVEIEDLIQEGVIGLIKGCMRFDYNVGVKFTTYVCYWIKQAIQMCVIKSVNVVKVPIRKTLKITKIRELLEKNAYREYSELSKEVGVKEDILYYLLGVSKGTLSIDYVNNEGCAFSECIPHSEDIYEKIYAKEKKNAILSVFKKYLSEKETEVLWHRFGFENGVKKTLREVARILNISPEGVRRIEKDAVTKLRASQNAKKELYEILL